MARQTPRTRKSVSATRVRVLSMFGFRYSAGRNAYVLRLVGNRVGPVYRVAAAPDPSTGAVTAESDEANGAGPPAPG